MKLGLAVLPLEVWANVFETPVISRQELAQIANTLGDWNFTEKLQKLLHECGKHSLRYIDISATQTDKTIQEQKIPECRAVLAVSPNGDGLSTYKQCEFPETEMPENITSFKRLSIRHLDDEVLGFLNKIKPLLTNAYLDIQSFKSAENMHILFTHLLPMLGSIIRKINCCNYEIKFFEQYFPRMLALAREMDWSFPEPAFFPAFLNWLSAPQQDMDQHGPRFFWAYADSKTISAIVDAVRKQFLAATTPSAFVICIEIFQGRHLRADKLTFENAATKEQLTVRNGCFKTRFGWGIPYVEIVRLPTGANVKMPEWIDRGKQAYFGKKHNGNVETNKQISIYGPTIGRITKKAAAANQDEDETNGEEAGPSAKKMKKRGMMMRRGGDELTNEDKEEAGPSNPAKKMKI